MSRISITIPKFVVKALNAYNVEIPPPAQPNAPQSFQELLSMIVKQGGGIVVVEPPPQENNKNETPQ
jgi:hypothetical protein